MSSYSSYLNLGNLSTDYLSLTKQGHEIVNFEFSFRQGVDEKGKASTRVYCGTILITLPMLPPDDIIEWALDSSKYNEGVIVTLDSQNMPHEKFVFHNAACISMDVDYTLKGDSYFFTKITVQAEQLLFGDGLDIDNDWVK